MPADKTNDFDSMPYEDGPPQKGVCQRLPMGESLKGMTPSMIYRYLNYDPIAMAIQDTWKFREPITTVSLEEWNRLLERQGIEHE